MSLFLSLRRRVVDASNVFVFGRFVTLPLCCLSAVSVIVSLALPTYALCFLVCVRSPCPLQAALRKPLVKMFSRRNPVHPFENASSLEFFSEKNDTSLFAMVSNTKKRPNNLVLGRMFDHKLLDMVEVGVEAYTPISECAGPSKTIGSKPCFVFQGDAFEHDPVLANFKNLLLDLFRGHVLDNVALPTLDHIIAVTAADGKVFFRVHSLLFRKSGTKVGVATDATCFFLVHGLTLVCLRPLVPIACVCVRVCVPMCRFQRWSCRRMDPTSTWSCAARTLRRQTWHDLPGANRGSALPVTGPTASPCACCFSDRQLLLWVQGQSPEGQKRVHRCAWHQVRQNSHGAPELRGAAAAQSQGA